MGTKLQDITTQALDLVPSDRIDLVERLLESVDGFVDPQIEDHWRSIATRRLAEHEHGEVNGIPADRVHHRIREKLNESRLPSGS